MNDEANEWHLAVFSGYVFFVDCTHPQVAPVWTLLCLMETEFGRSRGWYTSNIPDNTPWVDVTTYKQRVGREPQPIPKEVSEKR